MWRRSRWIKAPFIPKTTSHSSPLRFEQEAAYRLWAFTWPSLHSFCGISPSVQQVKDRLRRCIGTKSDGCAMIDAAWRQEKGKLCFIKRKDKHYISNERNFPTKKSVFSRIYSSSPKTRGLFLENALVSFIFSPLF